MKYVINILLLAVSVYLGMEVYASIQDPINFKEQKEERRTAVIEKLELIRDAQLNFKSNQGKFANSFPELINYLDTGNFYITSSRDSSFKYYNKTYREDQIKIITITDTLNAIPVKDSLFHSDAQMISNLAKLPVLDGKHSFEMKAGNVNKAGLDFPVVHIVAKKEHFLEGLNPRYVKLETDDLEIGSLSEVRVNGNW